MSNDTIEVLQPGFLTTVQDSGRHGYQRFGVPVSGAMDTFALRAGNLLVGNGEGEASLEITLAGPTLKFLADTQIAVTGSNVAPRLDDSPLPLWQPVAVGKGSVLSFESADEGVRCYLCVAGGVDVPVVLGSRSTYLIAAIGGLEGRALARGDILACRTPDSPSRLHGGVPEPSLIPRYGHDLEIRVVLGPQHRAFAPEGIFTFLNSAYTISSQADRTGYRLDGPAIQHSGPADIVSDGSPLGAVQVPGDGRPIILLADRGTTGGYPKIATVISADVSRLAQAAPGDTVAFKPVVVEEARAVRRDYESTLRALVSSAVALRDARPMSIAIEGQAFEVVDASGQPLSQSMVSGESRTTATHRARVTLDGRKYEFEVEVRRDR